MITVFYDGKCGLCSKEINHYKSIAPEGIFIWEDITQSIIALKREGISLSQGLKLLHAKDKNGQMHIGLDAFILIWGQLKRWKIVSKFASLPIVYQILTLAYKGFANWRFNRLTHCQIAAENEVKS
jgi:predicted DCC family thiol-disulfide oxidoreductase YuxK